VLAPTKLPIAPPTLSAHAYAPLQADDGGAKIAGADDEDDDDDVGTDGGFSKRTAAMSSELPPAPPAPRFSPLARCAAHAGMGLYFGFLKGLQLGADVFIIGGEAGDEWWGSGGERGRGQKPSTGGAHSSCVVQARTQAAKRSALLVVLAYLAPSRFVIRCVSH